jgi:3-methyladenine DNA glycosylase AlkD
MRQLASTRAGDWRRHLRRSIGWMLLVKLIALMALWTFFFSPAQRMHVTPDRVDSQLVIEVASENPHD